MTNRQINSLRLADNRAGLRKGLNKALVSKQLSLKGIGLDGEALSRLRLKDIPRGKRKALGRIVKVLSSRGVR